MNEYQPIRAITLDLDDTLWPVLPTLVRAEKLLGQWLQENAPATAALLRTEAASIRKALLDQYPENAHNMSWLRAELLRNAMAQAGDDSTLADHAFALFLAARQEVNIYEDVMDVLIRWSTQYPLIAISNGNADIERVGLGKVFHGAVSAHEQGCAKPDRRMFDAACELSGVAPEQTLHIGDDWTLDVLAARALSMKTAWIRRPDLEHGELPPGAGEEPFFEDLASLDEVLHGPSER